MPSPLEGLFDGPSIPSVLRQRPTVGRSSIFYVPPGAPVEPAPEPESYIGRASRYLQDAQDFIGGPKQALDLGIGLGADYLKSRGLDLGIDTGGVRGNEAGQLLRRIPNVLSAGEAVGNAVFDRLPQGIADVGRGAQEGLLEKGSALVTDPTLALLPEHRLVGAAFLPGIVRGAGEELGQAGAELGAGNYREAARHAAGGLVDTGFGILAGAHALGRRAPVETAPAERPTLQRPAFLDEVDRSAPAIPPGPELGYGRGGVPVNGGAKGVDLTADEAARIQQTVAAAQQPPQPPAAPAGPSQPVEPQAPTQPPQQASVEPDIQTRDTNEVGRLARMLPELKEPDLAKRLAFYESKGLQQSAEAVRAEIQRRQPPAPQPVVEQAQQPTLAQGEPIAPSVAPEPLAEPIAAPGPNLESTVAPAQGEQVANPYQAALSRLAPEERAAVEAEIHKARTTDPLTGLKNKAGWKELAESLGDNDHATVIDLKGFKEVNDTYGHDAADEILRSVGGLMRRHFGEESSRHGGDEFGAVIRGASTEEAQARVDAFNADLASVTHTLEGPNGERIDIPAVRAHIGLQRGRDAARSADLAANAHRREQGSGRRSTDRDVPDLPRSNAGTAALPEAGLQDRSPELASSPDNYPPEAQIASEVEAAVPSAITALSRPGGEKGGKVWAGTEHVGTLAPGMHPAKVEYGLEDFKEGASTIAAALKRDKGNPLEMRAKAAMGARFAEEMAQRGDAHETPGGDASFNPDEFGDTKFAVTQKTKAGEQVVMPGTLGMSENIPLKTEGREGEGPLFKQEEAARLKKEQESQGRLFKAGQPVEGALVTTEHVKAAFKAGTITESDNGWTVKLPGDRTIRVDQRGEIAYQPEAFEKGYGRKLKEGEEQIVGSFNRVGRDAIIQLAKGADPGVVLHEAFHDAMALALSPKERDAVLRHYKDEETAADAYAKWKPAEKANTLFGKIREFFYGIYRAFRPSWESAFEAARSGEAYERVDSSPAAEPKYATAPKTPPVFKQRAVLKPIPNKPVPKEELGRPMRPEEAHRVDTKVDNLKAIAPDVKLSRDAPRTWKSLDKEIRSKLEDIADDPKKEEAFYSRASSGKLNDVDVQVLDALVSGKREAFESVQQRLEKARAEGRDTGPDNVHLLGAALDRAAAELAVAAKSDVQAGTRLARALAARARVMEAAGKSTPDQFLRKVFKEIPGVTDGQAAELVKIMRDRPYELADALRAATKPSFFRKVLEFYKAGLLSGIPTHVANTSGNALEQSVRLAETATAAGVERLISKGPKERFAGEAGSELAGAGRAVGPAFDNLSKAVRGIFALEPESLNLSEKFDRQAGAISGKTGRAVRIPFRLLDVADQFFKEVGGEAEIGKLAYRKAASELRNAPEAVIRKRALKIAEEVRSENSDQHADIIEAVKESRKERTYQQDPGEIANAFLHLSQRHPALQLIAPFIRTPTNLAKAAISRSPLGLIDAAKAMREYKAGKITSGAAADRIARPLLGSAIFVTAYGVARGIAPGVSMTGSGPVDPKENAIWRDTGAQAYSFVLDHGDGKKTYVPFSRFEPLSTAFGVVADLAETKDQKNATDAASKVIGTIGNNLTNKTFLQGVTDFAAMVKDPTQFASQYTRNFAGSLVPNIVAKAAQAIDPTVRETKAESTGPLGLLQGAKNQIESRLPGVSTLLPERKSLTGEKIERPGNALTRFVSPVQVSETKPNTELEQLLVRIGYAPSAPKRDVTVPVPGGRTSLRLHLSDEEYETLQVAQKKAADFVRRNYLGNAGFERLPDTIEEGGQNSKEAYIKRVFDRIHTDSRRRLYSIPSFKMRTAEARQAILAQSKRPVA